jgi:hypothetical protein
VFLPSCLNTKVGARRPRPHWNYATETTRESVQQVLLCLVQPSREGDCIEGNDVDGSGGSRGGGVLLWNVVVGVLILFR